MTNDAAFERYHVLLLRRQPVNVPVLGRIGIFETYPVFSVWPIEGISSDVKVGRWRHFEGDVLRAHFGERWPKVLADELTPERQAFLRIDGEDASGQRYRLPCAVPEVLTSEVPARRGGRRAGSGMGVLVRHLREVEGIEDYHAILTLCERCGLAWVREALEASGTLPADRVAMLRKAFSNGKRMHQVSCPYCTSGLPEPWRTLLAA